MLTMFRWTGVALLASLSRSLSRAPCPSFLEEDEDDDFEYLLSSFSCFSCIALSTLGRLRLELPMGPTTLLVVVLEAFAD
jgi:hypothetical protein